MNETKICPLLLNGWISNDLKPYSDEKIPEQCECREDCAWRGGGFAQKCAFINSLNIVAAFFER